MSFTIHQATREMIGKRYHRLVVIGIGRHPKTNLMRMVCLCDCGNITYVPSTHLRILKTKSCGCWFRDFPRSGRITHGQCKNHVRSPEHYSWSSMKSRCLNPNCSGYRIYGARGIGIDPAWVKFEAFLKDMGRRPSKAYSLERIDNSKGYGPTNCKWATRREQSANKRTNHFITCNGLTLMLKDWAIKTGIHRRTISSRLKMGWPAEIALSLKPSFANNISEL